MESAKDLQQVVRRGRVVFVSGTGVSIAASSHPQASWAGLLRSGIAWLKEHKLMGEELAHAQLTLLANSPKTHRFISTAADVTADMGGVKSKHFADWLKRTVGAIKAKDRSVLDALHALRRHGHLLATTNYDGLLLDEVSGLDAVTWQETDDLMSAVRYWKTHKVIFLHGYWRKPQSVILDWNSYEQIARDDDYRGDLAAFWKTNTWVYVGCGVDGLSDPDFGLLLERYGERARQANHWDYCLVRGEDQRQEFQAYFDNHEFNIRAVSYGEDYWDLPAYLHSLLPQPVTPTPTTTPTPAVASPDDPDPIPKAPAFYAEPDYIGSHKFVGRRAELDALNDWANRSDPTNLLLFEAIGGNGKSMLTWEWTTRHATQVRSDWAGRFWYSFYEHGAIMEDFCQRALAYMTGRPLKELKKRRTAEMKDELIAQLHAQPWLLILDGLERVLVAYHRIDAAEVPDEEANAPTDKVLNRNPCDAIRDEDGDLLRALAASAPSKILVSSRLTPRVLLNPAGQLIPGAHRITLSGLRPSDAEQLLRSCGITGNSNAIQDYLRQNCDNHPLVIGILAGLINQPGPNRGNFGAWSTDPNGGAALNLAQLDLIQRRNHILLAAIAALPNTSRQLLSILALLSESVDYETLEAFNPRLPPAPEEVEVPEPPEEQWDWFLLSDEEKAKAPQEYEAALVRRSEYQKALDEWQGSAEVREAPNKLVEIVQDLEQRGLLQYDSGEDRYDLHPVVRGVASGGMEAEDKERYGQRVVDHFSNQSHRPYEEAQSLEDISSGLHVVRTLLKLGKFQQAADAFLDGLSSALLFNLEAYTDVLSLLRAFFQVGWSELPKAVSGLTASNLANDTAIALDFLGELQDAQTVYVVGLRSDLDMKAWGGVEATVSNISTNLVDQNLLAKALRVCALDIALARVIGSDADRFTSQLNLFELQSHLGHWREADATWRLLEPIERQWPRHTYRQGKAERLFARFQFWQGALKAQHLTAAATLAEQDNNRQALRNLNRLSGAWHLEQQAYTRAVASFQEAVRMARERRLVDAESETGLALAKFHLGQITGDYARSEAERLAQLRQPKHRYLAMLRLVIGDSDQAKHHALAAYRWAWADGEPYVRRYELTKTTELLEQMNIPIPELPPYDPDKDEPFPWEADVRAAIEELRAEKEAAEKDEE